MSALCLKATAPASFQDFLASTWGRKEYDKVTTLLTEEPD
jgi:hypothetical protein